MKLTHCSQFTPKPDMALNAYASLFEGMRGRGMRWDMEFIR